MTIAFEVQAGSPLTEEQEAAIHRLIQETFEEVDRRYNKWNPDSEISRFNQFLSTDPFPLSLELHALLLQIDPLVALTGGLFDPSIEPLQQLWQSKDYEPSDEEIAAIAPAIGWHLIHFDDHFIWKDHPLAALDLGGIAKGYAVDLLFERISEQGIPHIYVEWGGEIRVSQSHPEKRPWLVGITPLNPHQPPRLLSLANRAVATSGHYEQYRTAPSAVYSHVMNPLTLKPLRVKNGAIGSATVIAQKCVIADGIAKVGLFFDSEKEGEDWAKSLHQPELSFYFIEGHND
jgi:FAD:protein FMN transferase